MFECLKQSVYCYLKTWLFLQSTGVNIACLHTDSMVLIARCHSTPNLPVFNQICNEIYALYASAHLEWNAVLITTTFQLEWICYITPYHLSPCAYIKPHPIGWALRWNIMQIPNNKCTWLNSLSQQPEPCTHTADIPSVCLHTHTDTRDHALFANHVCQRTDIRYSNCQITKAHTNRAELLRFSPEFEKSK